MMFRLLWIFLLLVLDTYAYHTGAPDFVCDSMTPFHGTTVEDPSLPLYVSSTKLNGTNEYEVRIWAPDGFFKGFLLRALPLNSSQTLSGNFSRIPTASQKICGEQGVTHVDADNKTELFFTYTVDPSFTGNVYFKSTIVIGHTVNWKIASSTENQAVPSSTSGSLSTTVSQGVSTSSAGSISTSAGLPGSIEFDPQCGTSKGCSPSSCNGACSYLITWQNQGSHVTFEMMLDTSGVRLVGDVYHAIGFSDDDKMGGDNVIMCISVSGTTRVEVGSNNGKIYQPLSDKTKSLSEISITTNGAILKCTFNRDINSTDPEIFSLERRWNLLYARGIMAGNVPQHHSFRRASTSQVDFLAASLITATDSNKTMVKIHGSLMIIAWIFFSSIGIVTARHYKSEWPESSINKLKVWFQLHRGCMVLVFLCTSASFVVIFLEVEGYRKIEVTDSREYLESHPILGIVVTCLTCINPIMSLFRCAPDDKKRPIFNVAHFTVGTAAHILSAITIIFGMNLDQAGVPEEATYVMYAYVATFILIEIILEIWRIAGPKKDKDDSVQMNDIGIASQDSTPDNSLYKRKSRKPLVLYFHMAAMMAYTVTLVVIVFQNKTED